MPYVPTFPQIFVVTKRDARPLGMMNIELKVNVFVHKGSKCC